MLYSSISERMRIHTCSPELFQWFFLKTFIVVFCEKISYIVIFDLYYFDLDQKKIFYRKKIMEKNCEIQDHVGIHLEFSSVDVLLLDKHIRVMHTKYFMLSGYINECSPRTTFLSRFFFPKLTILNSTLVFCYQNCSHLLWEKNVCTIKNCKWPAFKKNLDKNVVVSIH